LADPQVRCVPDHDPREVRGRHAHHREIRERVAAHDLEPELAAVGEEGHSNSGTCHHVRRRDEVAVRREDDAAARAVAALWFTDT
jgi:hypothetical protein